MEPLEDGIRRLQQFAGGHVNRLSAQSQLDDRLTQQAFQSLCANIDDVLESALRSEGALARVAAKSYFHDNGFCKLVLDQASGRVAELRLHLWDVERTTPSENESAHTSVHSHSADFASYVLQGGLSEEVFSASDLDETDNGRSGSSPFSKYMCGPRIDAGRYELERRGTAFLRAESLREFAAGDVHGLRFDVLHRVEPTVRPTLTLFAQSPRRAMNTVVYAFRDNVAEGTIRSPPLDLATTRLELKRVQAVLEGNR